MKSLEPFVNVDLIILPSFSSLFHFVVDNKQSDGNYLNFGLSELINLSSEHRQNVRRGFLLATKNRLSKQFVGINFKLRPRL